jgi:hypothetical protein
MASETDQERRRNAVGLRVGPTDCLSKRSLCIRADFLKGGGRGVKKARKIRPAKKAKGDKSSRASTVSALASSRQGSGVNDNDTNMI